MARFAAHGELKVIRYWKLLKFAALSPRIRIENSAVLGRVLGTASPDAVTGKLHGVSAWRKKIR